MVAYSLQKRFEERILDGTKFHTIRGHRRRHARPGEELQLYTGMRTRQCRLICRARCVEVQPIVLVFDGRDRFSLPAKDYESVCDPEGNERALDRLAVNDGFTDWADLKAFWREQHPGVDRFEGVLISWSPLSIVVDRP